MRSLIAACVVLGLMAATPASAESILDGLPAGAIYADAMFGVGETTINKATGSVDDYIVDPLVVGHATAWGDDGFWTLNQVPPDGNGGIDATGSPGGTSFYSYDVVTPAPVLTTTAAGLDPGTNYNVFLAYYARDGGVQAAIEDGTLQTYTGYEIDTGVDAGGGAGSVKLKKLGEVTGVSSVGVDIANSTTNASWYEGVVAAPYTPLPSILDVLGDGAIYADAMFGDGGNTVNSVTGSVDDFIADPPDWLTNDGLWDHNIQPPNGNGGLNAAGEIGGTSLFSNDGVNGVPVITTTATGLDPSLPYNVYLAYYDNAEGIQAALSGQDLATPLDPNIDTGFVGFGTNTVKLALLGQVSGGSEVAIDVGNTGSAYYEGLAVQVVPEPSTMVLAFSGLLGLLLCAWRRRR